MGIEQILLALKRGVISEFPVPASTVDDSYKSEASVSEEYGGRYECGK